MAPYYENLDVIPYIYITKREFENKYEKFKNSDEHKNIIDKYDTIDKYRLDYCEYEMVDSDGNILSTYNKDSFWDCYEIGGRWYGGINRFVTPSSVNKTPSNIINDNSIQIRQYLKDFKIDPQSNIFSSIIDKNGVYHSKRNYGWFGESEEIIRDDTWENKYEKILNNCDDDYLIALDCHT